MEKEEFVSASCGIFPHLQHRDCSECSIRGIIVLESARLSVFVRRGNILILELLSWYYKLMAGQDFSFVVLDWLNCCFFEALKQCKLSNITSFEHFHLISFHSDFLNISSIICLGPAEIWYAWRGMLKCISRIVKINGIQYYGWWWLVSRWGGSWTGMPIWIRA